MRDDDDDDDDDGGLSVAIDQGGIFVRRQFRPELGLLPERNMQFPLPGFLQASSVIFGTIAKTCGISRTGNPRSSAARC